MPYSFTNKNKVKASFDFTIVELSTKTILLTQSVCISVLSINLNSSVTSN